MAILGRDNFGRINPGAINTPKEEKEQEESVQTPEMNIAEQPIEENPISNEGSSASLDFFDNMRKIRSGTKTPIGNSVQSDAKAFNTTNKF